MAVEEFPTFPACDSSDSMSVVGGGDEVMSIATDTSDEEQFVLLDGEPGDDVFGPPANSAPEIGEVGS